MSYIKKIICCANCKTTTGNMDGKLVCKNSGKIAEDDCCTGWIFEEKLRFEGIFEEDLDIDLSNY